MHYSKLIILCFIFIKLCRCREYLLPRILIPNNYTLQILTTLHEGGPNDFTFQGQVHIDAVCINVSNKITIHASHNLNIFSLSVLNLNTRKHIQIRDFSFRPRYDFLYIELYDRMTVSETYRISVQYRGKIANKFDGYYRSSYKKKDANGAMKKTWLALTFFEPTAARSVFPCFDEPIYKAKFKIILTHNEKLTAISNMPKIRSFPVGYQGTEKYIADEFQETLYMSTYMVAFLISDFGYELSHNRNTPIRVWARKNALSQVRFANRVAPKALSFYEYYFNMSFPLRKLDLVAVPDFVTGALENWGLIMFREPKLLYVSKASSKVNKRKITNIICHELAHQWFGNLVTMKWWNDLWLNEGFATYMSSKCVDALYPHWNYNNKKILTNMNMVFNQDSLATTIPLSTPVDDPKKIKQLYGRIAYKKGAMILNMMAKFLGENVLQAGVINYLRKYAYKNADQNDLWAALTEAAYTHIVIPEDVTIKEIMDTWTCQKGYPIIDVIRNYHKGSVTITQRRYLKYGNIHEDSSCWWVPLSYTPRGPGNFNDTKPKLWLTCPEKSRTIYFNNPAQWLIFNTKLSGLYRVNYDETNWKLIINHLTTKPVEEIDLLSRYSLLDNILSFAYVGLVDYELVFDMLEYLQYENNVLPWKKAIEGLMQISLLLETSSRFNVMKDYMKRIFKHIYLKFRNSSIPAFKILAFKSCRFELPECLYDVYKLFQSYIANPKHNSIPKYLRPSLYCNALKIGSRDYWYFFLKKYHISNVDNEKSMYLNALGCTRHKDLLRMYLDMILHPNSGIRKHDAYKVFSSVAKNEHGYEIAKSFLYQNGADIFKLFVSRPNVFAKYLHVIAEKITEDWELKEFNAFIERNPNFKKYISLGINQAYETIGHNINWYKKNFNKIINVLTKVINGS